MVFFSCNACGESLKKAAVEKHYQFQCRACEVLSCIDCGKDFPGDTYKQHTKCVSEEEKYSGKGYKPRPNANKGEAKQELWLQQVQEAINKTKTDPKLKGLLERIKDYPNIPRKKAKFENFLKNSLRVLDRQLVSRTWDVISVELNKPPPTQNTTPPSAEEPHQTETSEDIDGKVNDEKPKKLNKREKKEERRKQASKDEKKNKRKKSCDDKDEEVEEKTPQENGEKKKKKKKRKQEEEEIEDENEEEEPSRKKPKIVEAAVQELEAAEPDSSVKFSWEGVIVGVLKKAEDGELPIKRLRKKVLAHYAACGGDPSIKSEEKLWAKFDRKVSKNPRLRVLKDRVKLVH